LREDSALADVLAFDEMLRAPELVRLCAKMAERPLYPR
jgi:hypothetical protein